MGAIQSRDDASEDAGFLPQYHLLKLEIGDMDRLFVPRNFMNRCHLIAGGAVALLDCLGRTHSAVVESCCGVNYVGDGWPDFLKAIGAVRGDVLLLRFKSIRTCKVSLFNGQFGWQSIHPTNTSAWIECWCLVQQGVFLCWVASPCIPGRAVAAGPCTRAVDDTFGSSSGSTTHQSAEACGGAVFNADGGVIDRTMEEFLYDMAAIHALEIPMYYCRLGRVEMESGVLSLNREYIMSYVFPLMTGYRQKISIVNGSDDPIPCSLFYSFNGVAHIGEGGSAFCNNRSPNLTLKLYNVLKGLGQPSLLSRI